MTIQDDMVNCSEISEPFILWNILNQFEDETIYTSIGDILLCVNPFKEIANLYDGAKIDQIRSIKDAQGSLATPHVFNVANAALHGLTYRNKTQAIIISGESGSGKTEQTKRCLKFFASLSGSNNASARESDVISQRVLSANPILEAFGNAKTARNDNSSRFGKWIKIHFKRDANDVLSMIGCHTDHYLLEKARVTLHDCEERNFHVFYQFLAGASSNLKALCKIKDKLHSDFSYLNFGEAQLKNVDDSAEFESTHEALRNVGLETDSEIYPLFASIAGILFLGNINFIGGDKARAAADSTADLNECAFLLGVKPDRLDRALTTKERTVRGETITSFLNPELSTNARDALAKSIYGKMFDWLVERVNDSLKLPREGAMEPFIGVLDIFGFEILDANHFEQLCINYCNEKLQKYFIDHVIRLEEAMYNEENVSYSPSGIADNLEVLDLIEGRRGKPMGLFQLLDEESRLSKGSDKTFMSKIKTSAMKNKRFKVNVKFKESEFVVHHYAGTVRYETTGWIEKNKDELFDHLRKMMESSTQSFLKRLFASRGSKRTEEGGRAGHKITNKTESSKFVEGLESLKNVLDSSQPHFIRCIKPNSDKAPDSIDAKLVLEQLRYSGILDAVKIRKEGYPFRPSHNEFWKRYWPLAPHFHETVKADGSMDDSELCMTLLIQLQDLKHHKGDAVFQMFEHGLTRIFYRSEQHDLLESLRKDKRFHFATVAQRFTRGHMSRRRYKQLLELRGTMKVFVTLFNEDGHFFDSSEVEKLDSTMSSVYEQTRGPAGRGPGNLGWERWQLVGEASHVLLIIKAREEIKRGAQKHLQDLSTCTRETTGVLKHMKETLHQAGEYQMDRDITVTNLRIEAEKLEVFSEAQILLEECTATFERNKIDKQLRAVDEMEKHLKRPFCETAKKEALSTLKEISNEEASLGKLTKALNDTTKQGNVSAIPVPREERGQIEKSLKCLKLEISKWESAMPRSGAGVNLVESARLIYFMRSAVIENSVFSGSAMINVENDLSTGSSEASVDLQAECDSFLRMLNPMFSIAQCVKSELSLIQAYLAKLKYLPAIKEHLKMPLRPAAVGEIQAASLVTQHLEGTTKEAISNKMQDFDEECKSVVEQALTVIDVRNHMRLSNWSAVISSTEDESLPQDTTLIREETDWAKTEALDRKFQSDLSALMSEGAIVRDADVPLVKYDHIESIIRSEHLRVEEDKFLSRHSQATLDLIDTALLTIEVRKLQEASEWGSVLSLFKGGIAEKLRFIEPSDEKRRRSRVLSDAIQEAGTTLRGEVTPGLPPKESGKPIIVERYPRASMTEEMAIARSDASHRILNKVLIPAISSGGATGTIGNVDLSKVTYKSLSGALEQAAKLPLEMGEDTQLLVDEAKVLLRFRKILSKGKSSVFEKRLDEFVELANLHENKPMDGSADGEAFKDLLRHPGQQELNLLVGQVRYVQLQRDLPRVLKTGAASGVPGDTVFSTLDCDQLDRTIDMMERLPSTVRCEGDIPLLEECVVAVSKIRKSVRKAFTPTAGDFPAISNWDEIMADVQKLTSSGIVEKLPPSCSSDVRFELDHLRKECAHQLITKKAERSLESGGLSGSFELGGISYELLNETLGFADKIKAAEGNFETDASSKILAAVGMARDLRKLLKESVDSESMSAVRELLQSRNFSNPSFPLPPALLEEIEICKDFVVNSVAIERLEVALSGNAIEGQPGMLKGGRVNSKLLKDAIRNTQELERTRSEGTEKIISAANIILSIRELINERSNFEDIRRQVVKFDGALSSYLKKNSSKFHLIRQEIHLADLHMTVIEVSERLCREALQNKISLSTHLENASDEECGTLKDVVNAIDMSKVDVEAMDQALGDAKQLLKPSGYDCMSPTPYFRELTDVCESIFLLRKNLLQKDFISVSKGLYSGQGMKKKFSEKRELYDETNSVGGTTIADQESTSKQISLVYHQERLIARQENNEHQILHLLERTLTSGGVAGVVGNVNYSNLSVTELHSSIQVRWRPPSGL